MDTRQRANGFTPVGRLGLIALPSCRELGSDIDRHLVAERERLFQLVGPQGLPNGVQPTYLLQALTPRFQSGDAKGVLCESVRGKDIYILADVGNYALTYSMFGHTSHMSPDEHFQDIKRIISAAAGHEARVTVIMPLLYSGRQHRRTGRESLDCAMALQELERMGVRTVITFEVHDPRVANAVPLMGFESLSPSPIILEQFLETEPGLRLDHEHLIVISPDTGGLERAVSCATALGVEVGAFYKRRNLTRLVNGRYPVAEHVYMGAPIQGRDCLVVDDMISSGDSVFTIVPELEARGAQRIFVAVSFALFTEGIGKFDELCRADRIQKLYATNLTYMLPELRAAPWFHRVDMSAMLAELINRLNYDQSISELFDVAPRIRALVERHRGGLGPLFEGQREAHRTEQGRR
ncbi:MAG: ribose-phosphate pyrophosphokinase [Chloroflexota bacterium]